MKAILIIDDIQEEWFENNLSAKFELIYYPNGEMKELGIHGKCHLKPFPQKRELNYATRPMRAFNNELSLLKYAVDKGYNKAIDDILGGEE